MRHDGKVLLGISGMCRCVGWREVVGSSFGVKVIRRQAGAGEVIEDVDNGGEVGEALGLGEAGRSIGTRAPTAMGGTAVGISMSICARR